MPLRLHSPEILLALVLALVLVACAGPQTSQGPELLDPAAFQAGTWVETDAVLRLNNGALASHFRSELMALGPVDGVELRGADFDFAGPSIDLAITALFTGPGGMSREVVLEGEVVLSFSSAGLRWFPQIERVSASADPDTQDLVQRVNAALIRQIVMPAGNSLGVSVAPPRQITFSARLPGLAEEAVTAQYTLQGAYTVAASRIHADPDFTTIALDLEYVQGISHCAVEFTISRSAFARRIVNREPRGIEARLDPASPEWHYFTEVSEARRHLILVHYWFADGRPIGVTELAVEPSARWRTWSSLPVKPGVGRHIEVFAADRDSGCIVDAGHIELAPAAGEHLEGTFEAITQPFPATAGRPRIALAELSPTVLSEALNQASAEGRFAVRLDVGGGAEQPLSGHLGSLAALDFQCQWRDCAVPTECRVDFSRCQRKQDTRDCTTCLFRNPLNDRCVSERVDAECEARKARVNARYAQTWEDCMAREEALQNSCEERGQEALEVCEERARLYQSACAANRESLRGHAEPVATLAGHARVGGEITLVFSELHALAGFERLKALLKIEPDLSMEGALVAAPEPGLDELRECIARWDSPFEIRLDRPQSPRRLVGVLQAESNSLSVSWPGMTIPLTMAQGPFEVILERHPQWLDECQLGLTPAQLGARAGGESGFVLRGILPLDVQPGPARITLAPMTATLEGKTFSATAAASEGYFRYELAEHETSSD